MGARHACTHNALDLLHAQSTYLLTQSIATSTTRNYNYAMQSFQTFCNYYDLNPRPPSEQTLILYGTHVASYSSHSNVKLHMAAIKHFTITAGHYLDFKNFHRLYLLLKGIKRAHGKRYSLPKRQPITPSLLHLIKQNLFNSSRAYEDKLMLWAALTTAFFGFLRVSEYTSTHKKNTTHSPLCCTRT